MADRADYTKFGLHLIRNETGELVVNSGFGTTLSPAAAADVVAWLVQHFPAEQLTPEELEAEEDAVPEHINASTGPVEVPKRRGPGRPRKEAS